MQTNLEKYGISARTETIVKNDFSEVNQYDAQKASQENGGKGTNSGGPSHTQIIDVLNGGSNVDINGNENISFSGRKKNLTLNAFGPDKPYPYNNIDTSLNSGQVIIQ